MSRPAAQNPDSPTYASVILNWTEELKHRVPVKQSERLLSRNAVEKQLAKCHEESIASLEDCRRPSSDAPSIFVTIQMLESQRYGRLLAQAMPFRAASTDS
jgi:hypothetical protein